MNTNMRLVALILILISPTWAASEYTDKRFSVKGIRIFVNILDDARDGCWTNIGEVRTYMEDKLSENGAIVVGKGEAGVVLNLRVLARRWTGVGWCYGSMTLSLNVEGVVRNTDLRVNGSLYRKSSIDIEPENFNITALTWLGDKLKELD